MSFSTDDTIVAIATPAGRGGIGVVRISGGAAVTIARGLTHRSSFEPRRATLVRVHGTGTVDEAIVTVFPAPTSYTGEDVVEISAHGSPVLLRSIVDAAVASGARLAEPGEFTLRAYLSGRMDLVQAEAVRDLVDAVTPLQARAAFDQLEGTLTARIRAIDAALFDLSARLEASLDFAEEGYHFVEPDRVVVELGDLTSRIDALLTSARAGRLVREGALVVIAGRPNAGKSTLFNAMVNADRAIVTDIPGTTRDLLAETIDVGGLAVTLVDTAGMRMCAADVVEAEGIARARQAADRAHLTIVVLDRSLRLTADDEELLARSASNPRVVVAAKADLPPAGWALADVAIIEVSSTTGAGIGSLRDALVAALGAQEVYRDVPAVTNLRHVHLLERARAALVRACSAAQARLPEEFIAADILEARTALEEVTGRRTADDTLTAIFERFCIGK